MIPTQANHHTSAMEATHLGAKNIEELFK